MLIQQAIRSGKPFKRTGYSAWISPTMDEIEMLSSVRYFGSDQRVRFTVDDILADDWELKSDGDQPPNAVA